MQLIEAIPQLDDEEDHKFVLNLSDSPLFIMKTPLTWLTKLTMFTHEDVVIQMRKAGIFGEEEVVGGYCRVHNAVLKYWGESSSPIHGAGRQLFNEALQSREITFITPHGKLV